MPAAGCCVQLRAASARGSPISFARMSPPDLSPRRAVPEFRSAPRVSAALASASASAVRIEIIRPTLGVRRSALRRFARLLWPRLTSDNASEDLSIFVAHQHAVRSPRVLRTDLHAYARRIYVAAFRTRIGLCIFGPAHPAALASIRFLFVAPALCFRLPSDLGSPQEPLPSANTSPCRVCRGLPPPSRCALPGAPKKTAGRGPPSLSPSGPDD